MGSGKRILDQRLQRAWLEAQEPPFIPEDPWRVSGQEREVDRVSLGEDASGSPGKLGEAAGEGSAVVLRRVAQAVLGSASSLSPCVMSSAAAC